MTVPSNWLDLVPTCSDVYVYQADLVCEDCATKIMEELDEQGVEDDGDSGTYPQGPHGDGGGEADSANFCGMHRGCVNAVNVAGTKIGCPLDNPLTSEGAMAVQDTVRRDLLSTKKYARMIGRLIRQVWRDYVSNEECIGPAVVPPTFPASLKKLLMDYSRKSRSVVETYLVLDADHDYFVGRRGDEVDLLRASTNDEGEFKNLDVASVPGAVLEGRDPRDAIVDAVSEGAWD
jgi:hypothetical protein